MRKRIKIKILFGFLVIIGMLAAAGGISIYEFIKISGSVKAMIKDNYKTIQAGKSMIEALERKDSGVLLLLLGQYNHGSDVLQYADSAFSEALNRASSNITEVGEHELIKEIERKYAIYHQSVREATDLRHTDHLTWYRDIIHQQFYETKELVNALIEMNQEAMFIESTQLEQQSKRALMPGIVSISAALIFLLLLNFFISKYFVQPVVKLTQSIRRYSENPTGNLLISMDSEDELRDLRDAVEKLVIKFQQEKNPQ